MTLQRLANATDMAESTTTTIKDINTPTSMMNLKFEKAKMVKNHAPVHLDLFEELSIHLLRSSMKRTKESSAL